MKSFLHFFHVFSISAINHWPSSIQVSFCNYIQNEIVCYCFVHPNKSTDFSCVWNCWWRFFILYFGKSDHSPFTLPKAMFWWSVNQEPLTFVLLWEGTWRNCVLHGTKQNSHSISHLVGTVTTHWLDNDGVVTVDKLLAAGRLYIWSSV